MTRQEQIMFFAVNIVFSCCRETKQFCAPVAPVVKLVYSPSLQTVSYPVLGPFQAKGFSPFSSSAPLYLFLYRFLSHPVRLILIFCLSLSLSL